MITKILITPIFIFLFLLGCQKQDDAIPKTIWKENEIERCVCKSIPQTQICYYDTVKTFLLELQNVTGTLTKYYTGDRVGGIQLDNSQSYIKGSSEFGKPFYWWKIVQGYLNPCNLPSEIVSNSSYFNKRIKFSCKVDFIPPPPSGFSYPSMEGHSVILTAIEILP